MRNAKLVILGELGSSEAVMNLAGVRETENEEEGKSKRSTSGGNIYNGGWQLDA